MRCTCVSTQMFCRLLNARISTRLAVLRPTPGSVTSSSIVAGTRPPKRVDQHLAARLHVPRLVAIEADRIDQPLDLLHRQLRHRPRRARPLEQPRRRRVRRRVLGARRQQRGDQDLKRILGLLSEIFSTAGSSSPSMARASARMTVRRSTACRAMRCGQAAARLTSAVMAPASAAAGRRAPRRRCAPRDRPSPCASRSCALPRCGASSDVLERQQIRDAPSARARRRRARRRQCSRFLQRPGQRRLVDDRAARRVDQIRRPLHPRERRLVDQVPRLGRQRHVQRDDVRRRQQAIERHRARCAGSAAGARDVQRRACRTPPRARPRPADAAEADDAELLAAQLGAEHEVERPALPAAAPDQALAFGQPARDAEDQRPGEIGGRLGQHVGRVGDDDAALARGRRRRCCCSRPRRWRSPCRSGARLDHARGRSCRCSIADQTPACRRTRASSSSCVGASSPSFDDRRRTLPRGGASADEGSRVVTRTVGSGQLSGPRRRLQCPYDLQ